MSDNLKLQRSGNDLLIRLFVLLPIFVLSTSERELLFDNYWGCPGNFGAENTLLAACSFIDNSVLASVKAGESDALRLFTHADNVLPRTCEPICVYAIASSTCLDLGVRNLVENYCGCRTDVASSAGFGCVLALDGMVPSIVDPLFSLADHVAEVEAGVAPEGLVSASSSVCAAGSCLSAIEASSGCSYAPLLDKITSVCNYIFASRECIELLVLVREVLHDGPSDDGVAGLSTYLDLYDEALDRAERLFSLYTLGVDTVVNLMLVPVLQLCALFNPMELPASIATCTSELPGVITEEDEAQATLLAETCSTISSYPCVSDTLHACLLSYSTARLLGLESEDVGMPSRVAQDTNGDGVEESDMYVSQGVRSLFTIPVGLLIPVLDSLPRSSGEVGLSEDLQAMRSALCSEQCADLITSCSHVSSLPGLDALVQKMNDLIMYDRVCAVPATTPAPATPSPATPPPPPVHSPPPPSPSPPPPQPQPPPPTAMPTTPSPASAPPPPFDNPMSPPSPSASPPPPSPLAIPETPPIIQYFLVEVRVTLSMSPDEITDGMGNTLVADILKASTTAETITILGEQAAGEDSAVVHLAVLFEAQEGGSGDQLVTALRDNLIGEDVFSPQLGFLSTAVSAEFESHATRQSVDARIIELSAQYSATPQPRSTTTPRPTSTQSDQQIRLLRIDFTLSLSGVEDFTDTLRQQFVTDLATIIPGVTNSSASIVRVTQGSVVVSSAVIISGSETTGSLDSAIQDAIRSPDLTFDVFAPELGVVSASIIDIETVESIEAANERVQQLQADPPTTTTPSPTNRVQQFRVVQVEIVLTLALVDDFTESLRLQLLADLARLPGALPGNVRILAVVQGSVIVKSAVIAAGDDEADVKDVVHDLTATLASPADHFAPELGKISASVTKVDTVVNTEAAIAWVASLQADEEMDSATVRLSASLAAIFTSLLLNLLFVE
mmetsp:Transcript_32362/g.57926  ORF Transcript_32362/g.57926 Transcript_32362/m.57926 type:complete len:957 (-) Transcript_32362:391-3261(-)